MKGLKLLNNIWVKNLLLAIAVFLLLIFGVLKWLDIYTKHGSRIEIPDVRGMQVDEAAHFFTQKKLNYEVIDSAFVRNKQAGSILETMPPSGSFVKEGRTIYITINAKTAKLLTVPYVKDMSQRQALAILKSVGFETIEVKLIPGVFKELVLGLESKGQSLEQGDRLPANTPLTLLVSLGNEGNILWEEDSVNIDVEIQTEEITSDESWF